MQARWNRLSVVVVLCGLPAAASGQSIQDAVAQLAKGAAETAGKVGEAAVNTAAKIVSSPAVQNAAKAATQGAGQVAQVLVDGAGSIASNRDLARVALAGTQVVNAAGAVTQPVRTVAQEVTKAAIDRSPIPGELRPLAKEVAGIVLDKNPAEAAAVAAVEAGAHNALSSESNGAGPRARTLTGSTTQGTTSAGNSADWTGGYQIAAMDSSIAARQTIQQQTRPARPQGDAGGSVSVIPNQPV